MAHAARTTAAEVVPVGDVRQLLARAEQGDNTALPELRRFLDANPQVWQSAGDLAARAEAAWVGLAAGDNLLMGESLARTLAALKAGLAGPDPSPLERLLVGRVAACWVQVHYADAAAALARGRDLTLAQLDHLQRRQERAQRGYLAAVKALALVRKLIPPVAAASAAPSGVEQGPCARPEKARAKPSKNGRREKTKKAARGGNGSVREAVIPEPLRKRLRGMIVSKN